MSEDEWRAERRELLEARWECEEREGEAVWRNPENGLRYPKAWR